MTLLLVYMHREQLIGTLLYLFVTISTDGAVGFACADLLPFPVQIDGPVIAVLL